MRSLSGISIVSLLGGIIVTASTLGAPVSLLVIRTTVLSKADGDINQAVPLPDGGYLVRDANFGKEREQRLEVFNRQGHLIRKIGGFGPGSGEYRRLLDVAVQRDGTIWVADVTKILRFSSTGQFLDSILIQNPGYIVTAVGLDESRGSFYLGGCAMGNDYATKGCKQLHEYSITQGKYIQSLWQQDSAVSLGNLHQLQEYKIDVTPQGTVFGVDSVVHKVCRIDPHRQQVKDLPFHTRLAKTPTALLAGQVADYYDRAFEEASFVDRVFALGPTVAVSIRLPYGGGEILELLTAEGGQLAEDLPLQGRLVGRSEEGTFFIAVKRPGAFELRECKVTGNP